MTNFVEINATKAPFISVYCREDIFISNTVMFIFILEDYCNRPEQKKKEKKKARIVSGIKRNLDFH